MIHDTFEVDVMVMSFCMCEQTSGEKTPEIRKE